MRWPGRERDQELPTSSLSSFERTLIGEVLAGFLVAHQRFCRNIADLLPGLERPPFERELFGLYLFQIAVMQSKRFTSAGKLELATQVIETWASDIHEAPWGTRIPGMTDRMAMKELEPGIRYYDAFLSSSTRHERLWGMNDAEAATEVFVFRLKDFAQQENLPWPTLDKTAVQEAAVQYVEALLNLV